MIGDGYTATTNVTVNEIPDLASRWQDTQKMSAASCCLPAMLLHLMALSAIGSKGIQSGHSTPCTTAGFFPHPSDCRLYYSCDWKGYSLNAVLYSCNEGYLYDVKSRACKLAQTVPPRDGCLPLANYQSQWKPPKTRIPTKPPHDCRGHHHHHRPWEKPAWPPGPFFDDDNTSPSAFWPNPSWPVNQPTTMFSQWPHPPPSKPERPSRPDWPIKPGQPDARPDQNTPKPEHPDIRPVQPAPRPEQPDIRPVQPAPRPEQPDIRPVQPAPRPDQPDIRPVQPAPRPDQPRPTLRPEEPFLRPVQPTFRPERPNTRPGQPTLRPERPVLQPEEPFLRPVQPASRPERPNTRPEEPFVRPQRPNIVPEESTRRPTASTSLANRLTPPTTPTPTTQAPTIPPEIIESVFGRPDRSFPPFAGREPRMQCNQEGFFRHPTDCRNFYRCVEWTPGIILDFHFYCPAGQVYRADLKGCGLPQPNSRTCPGVNATDPSRRMILISGREVPNNLAWVQQIECPAEVNYHSKPDVFYTCTMDAQGDRRVAAFSCPPDHVFLQTRRQCVTADQIESDTETAIESNCPSSFTRQRDSCRGFQQCLLRSGRASRYMFLCPGALEVSAQGLNCAPADTTRPCNSRTSGQDSGGQNLNRV